VKGVKAEINKIIVRIEEKQNDSIDIQKQSLTLTADNQKDNRL